MPGISFGHSFKYFSGQFDTQFPGNFVEQAPSSNTSSHAIRLSTDVQEIGLSVPSTSSFTRHPAGIEPSSFFEQAKKASAARVTANKRSFFIETPILNLFWKPIYKNSIFAIAMAMTEKTSVKDKIMGKALELLSAKGYEGVSVNELTVAAGITKPTLYYYFGSKEGLFEAVSQLHYACLNSIIEKSAVYSPNPNEYEKDVLKTLSKVTKAYFSYAQSNEAFYMCILANSSMPRSSAVFKIVEKYHFAQFDIIENMFKSMAKTHGNLNGKAKMLTWSFIGTINSYISLHFSGFAVQKFDERSVRELVRQFMHGVFA